MANVDYDAPRTPPQPLDDSLEFLQEQRAAATAGADVAEHDFSQLALAAGYDIPDEDLTVTVVPIQSDEFLCGSCFMVLHRGLSAGIRRRDDQVCRDCA